MEELKIVMPTVAHCAVSKCAYNVRQKCHARAITVGDAQNPGCDTYFPNDQHSRETRGVAGVGACKVTACSYNTDFECTADSIRVDYAPDASVKCVTFTPR